MGHSWPLFSLLSSFQYSWLWMFNNFFCQWLDSNRGPLALEATALPTEPQQLPKIYIFLTTVNIKSSIPEYNTCESWEGEFLLDMYRFNYLFILTMSDNIHTVCKVYYFSIYYTSKNCLWKTGPKVVFCPNKLVYSNGSKVFSFGLAMICAILEFENLEKVLMSINMIGWE